MSDERKGCPSASIIERLMLCPGSWNAAKGKKTLRSAAMEKLAGKGERVHLWLESPQLMDGALKRDELILAKELADKRCGILNSIGFMDLNAVWKEKRLWNTDGDPRYSGRIDYTAIRYDHFRYDPSTANFVVIDYKTGWGDQTDVVENPQIRTQCVLAAMAMEGHGYRVSQAWGAIAQAKLPIKDSIVAYSPEDLAKSKAQIRQAIIAAQTPDAPLRAGKKQCEFCPAKLTCKAYSKWIEMLPETKEDISSADGALLAEFLERWKSYQSLGKAIEEKAKELLCANADSVPGWMLKPSGAQRSVKDAQGLWSYLFKNNYMTEVGQFLSIVSVGIGDLESQLAAVNKYGKKETANVMAQLEAFIERKEKAPSLVKK